MGVMTKQINEARLSIDAQCALGEGATWCDHNGQLYWTDIEDKRLWRYSPLFGEQLSWEMPERLASFALTADSKRLLLGLAEHLAFFHLATGTMQHVADVEPNLNTRINDGRCDRQGRFVFGTMDEGSPKRAIGGFYRLNLDLSLERLPLPSPAIANSIAFSPDGETMYYCDSLTREIRACDYFADGRIDNDRVFTQLTDAQGVPDGSTVDASGCLWNAQWGGARVVRYGADGVEAERVNVPSRQPTCVALGGMELDTLYITTGRIGLSDHALAEDPHAGGVFAARVARRGLPEPRFAGEPRAKAKREA
jgi:L-arabinonolactonase